MKGPGDYVSQADHKAEKIQRDELARARPGYGFLLEEGGVVEGEDAQHRWIVDPLDGTTNFLHGIPHWCISIALQRRLQDGSTEIAAGMIYNPVHDEMFWAEKGIGAYLNERRLRVSARRELKDALFATGIPFAAVSGQRRLAFARTLGVLMPQVAGIRRFGSAALDLAWVAAGRYDGYWESDLKPWDAAAGVLLVKEAGGYVTDFRGGDRAMERSEFLAANDGLHTKLHKLLAGALR